jgi:nucleoside-diphosphate-sugar epimerase
MDAGVRKFVYCSTCGVHGNGEQPPAPEDAPIQPADYYQQTKYDAEPLVLDFCRRGLKATILRPAAIFGPGDPGRFLMIFRQVARGWFPMFGDGRTLYHPLYIENFLDAFEIAMREDRGVGGTYLIADATYLSIENLVLAVAKAMNRSVRIVHLPIWPIVALPRGREGLRALQNPPPIHPAVDRYRQTRAFSIERAARLAFVPAVSLMTGCAGSQWYFGAGDDLTGTAVNGPPTTVRTDPLGATTGSPM